MNDIVFPKKNEEAFLALAKQWGISLLFVYPSKKAIPEQYKAMSAVVSKQAQGVFTVCKGSNRKALEQGVSLVYELENAKEKDKIFSRRSGLNQVLAKIAHQKGTTVGFSFSLFKNGNSAVILGRMRQNYKLCKKYKVAMLVASFVDKPEDMIHPSIRKAFLRLLDKR